VRARIMVVVGGRVNQPEVSPMRLQKGHHSVQKCLSPRHLPRSDNRTQRDPSVLGMKNGCR
jgi:hypothetical protein